MGKYCVKPQELYAYTWWIEHNIIQNAFQKKKLLRLFADIKNKFQTVRHLQDAGVGVLYIYIYKTYFYFEFHYLFAGFIVEKETNRERQFERDEYIENMRAV